MTEGPFIALNDGHGNFSDGVALSDAGAFDAFGGIGVGRIDAGASPDIAVGTRGGIDLYLNDGDAGFTLSPRSPLAGGRFFDDTAITDVDGDGRSDLIAGEADGHGGAVAVFLRRRHGGFKEADTSPEDLSGHGLAPSLATGKFDQRKGRDIAAATGESGTLSILLNRSR